MKENDYIKENSETIIFCFSGTGNSLRVALKLKEKITHCKICSISKAFNEKAFEINASKIGFVFPVYFFDIPRIVEKFIKSLKILGTPYIFAIVTCGGNAGQSLKKVNKLLHTQQKTLNAAFKVVFPGNAIVMFNETPSQEKIPGIIENSELAIEKIIDCIDQNQSSSFTPDKNTISNRIMSWSGKLFLYHLINDRTFKVDEDKCIQCKTCVSVCPVNNIKIINEKVSWGHHCECCAACIHWCPSGAIQNMKTRGIPRYHHPAITIKMIKSY